MLFANNIRAMMSETIWESIINIFDNCSIKSSFCDECFSTSEVEEVIELTRARAFSLARRLLSCRRFRLCSTIVARRDMIEIRELNERNCETMKIERFEWSMSVQYQNVKKNSI